MRKIWTTTLVSVLSVIIVLVFSLIPTFAGNIVLSNNSGAGNPTFVIEGEPSLVMNGFNLSSQGVSLPIALDAVSISIDTPQPGVPVDIVIYQDSNGGSPSDATLVYRQSTSLGVPGVNRIVLDTAAVITEPVIWVGFYLPVGIKFHADNSGSSVLTYWAWTPGGSFDVSSLSNAQILGPGDGTAPVNINMGGVARITAELRQAVDNEVVSSAPIGVQIQSNSAADTSILEFYPYCGTLLYDPQDIIISAAFSFTTKCRVKEEHYVPTILHNPDGQILNMQRSGLTYEIEAYIHPDLLAEGDTQKLPVPVTHCLRIISGDIDRAVVAEAHGVPAVWYVRPSVRYGDLVCAEITHAGYISYFLPRTEESPPNVNLVVAGWAWIDPHPLKCGFAANANIPIVNTGLGWFSTQSTTIKIILEDIHVRTGIVTGAVEQKISTSALGPGMTLDIEMSPLYITAFVGELHRLQVRVDFDNQIQETNEFDNIWFTEYILEIDKDLGRCASVPPTLTPITPVPTSTVTPTPKP